MQIPPPPPPPMSPPPPPQEPIQPAYGAAYAPQLSYGGFWIRFVAYLIDWIILVVPLSIVGGIIGGIAGVAMSNNSNSASSALGAAFSGVLLLFDLFAFVVIVGYFVYFWSVGATVGMRVFKLRVVDAATGMPIGIGRAILRYIGWIISVLPCYIGLIWAAFDPRKQGWHDKIATSVVVQG
jgi:uncharacterized RDD family membrane protein YckC